MVTSRSNYSCFEEIAVLIPYCDYNIVPVHWDAGVCHAGPQDRAGLIQNLAAFPDNAGKEQYDN